MNIKWNEVTWYSKLLAVILFLLVVPYLTFYIGKEYQKTFDVNDLYSNINSTPKLTNNNSVEKLKTSSSTTEGITYEFKVPEEFTKIVENVGDDSQTTLYLANEEKLSFTVLKDISSRNDLIKKESARNNYKGKPGQGNYSEANSGTWEVMKASPFDRLSHSTLLTNINPDFVILAESTSSSEGQEYTTYYTIYIAPKGFPGKVLAVRSEPLTVGYPSEYLKSIAAFFEVVESLRIYDYN